MYERDYELGRIGVSFRAEREPTQYERREMDRVMAAIFANSPGGPHRHFQERA